MSGDFAIGAEAIKFVLDALEETHPGITNEFIAQLEVEIAAGWKEWHRSKAPGGDK